MKTKDREARVEEVTARVLAAQHAVGEAWLAEMRADRAHLDCALEEIKQTKSALDAARGNHETAQRALHDAFQDYFYTLDDAYAELRHEHHMVRAKLA